MKDLRRIGFVDNQLDNFHANTYLSLLRGPLQERGFRVAGAVAWHAESAAAWSAKTNVPLYGSVADLANEVDFFMVLAPSDPHLHFNMCEQVLPYGRPTFVDKTFAPNTAVAEQIFALADRYSSPLQTTSALRTTNVQRSVRELAEPLRNVYVWAGGTSFEEYGIHPVELVVSCLGPGVTHVMRNGTEQHSQLILQFEEQRTGIIDFNATEHVDFAAAITTDRSSIFLTVAMDSLFRDAMSSILDFFETGRPAVDRAETLAIHRVLEIAMLPQALNRFCGLHAMPRPHIKVGRIAEIQAT